MPLTAPGIQAAIRAAKRGEQHAQQVDLRDGGGLFLRVFGSGSASWYADYRTLAGARRRWKLGDLPGLSLAGAREQLEALRVRVRAGGDPLGEQRTERARPKALTVTRLFEEFFGRREEQLRATERPRSAALDRWYFETIVRPRLGKRPAGEITQRDLVRLLDDVASGAATPRGKPTTSAPRALRTLLSRVYRWAVPRGYVEGNPVAGISLAVPAGRDRVLTPAELRALWVCLEDLEAESALSAHAFRLLLLTGQRPGEVLGMRWAELDGDWWEIPAARAKSGRAHRVPLVPWALRELAALRELTGAKRHVFDSPRAEGSPLASLKTSCSLLRARMARAGIEASGLTVTELAGREGLQVGVLEEALRRAGKVRGQRVGDRVRGRRHLVEVLEQVAGVSRWTPHDLRRTVATGLAEAGVTRFTIERVLGHSDHTVTARYDRHEYAAEKQAALLAWQGRLERLLAAPRAAQVVAIGRRA